MSAWHEVRWQWQTADDLNVEIAVKERRPDWGLTSLERRIVARELTAREVPAAEIAEIVGVAQRTVHRWRTEDRRAA